jgi:hypothetical protein
VKTEIEDGNAPRQKERGMQMMFENGWDGWQKGPMGRGAYAFHKQRLGVVCHGPDRDNMVKLRYGA